MASARAQQAVTDDDADVIPCGMGKAQENGNSVYGLLPKPFSENMGIEQGSPLKVAYHPETQSFIIQPIEV